MRILHIVHSSHWKDEYKYLGSTRDMLGREEYFRARGVEYDQISPLFRDDGDLLDKLKKIDLSPYDAVFFEKTDFPQCMEWVRTNHPAARIILRVHNAEFLHRIHYEVARFDNDVHGGMTRNLDRIIFDHVLAYNRLCHDLCCAHLADAVLSITRWEAENYWPLLTDPAKVYQAPFYLPDRDSTNDPAPPAKEPLCLCVLSPAHMPLLENAGKAFIRLAEQAGETAKEWRFAVTGDPQKYDFPPSGRVEMPGLLSDPMATIATARCIALLSDYGFGFKTKILEAIAKKCWIITTKQLFGYLPHEVRPYCIVIDKDSPEQFVEALRRSLAPYPEGDPNALFKSLQYEAMDKALSAPPTNRDDRPHGMKGEDLLQSWPMARRTLHKQGHSLAMAQAMLARIMPYIPARGGAVPEPLADCGPASLAGEYLALNEKFQARLNASVYWKTEAKRLEREVTELKDRLQAGEADSDT